MGVVDRPVRAALERPVALDLAEHHHLVRAGQLPHQGRGLGVADRLQLLRIGGVGHRRGPLQPDEAGGLQAQPGLLATHVVHDHGVGDQGERGFLPLDVVLGAGRCGGIDVVDHRLDIVGLRLAGMHGSILEEGEGPRLDAGAGGACGRADGSSKAVWTSRAGRFGSKS